MSDNLSTKRFTTGSGEYLDDIDISDVVSASFVRSPFAHTRVLNIHKDPAEEIPGVLAVWTAEDLALKDIPGDHRTPEVPTVMARPPLARGIARYTGEPLAIVLSDDRASGADAASLVYVDLDPLPTVVDVRDALESETLLFPEAGSNVAIKKQTSLGNVPDDLPISVELDLFHPRIAPTPMESLGLIAIPDDKSLIVWCSHQAPHRLRRELADALNMDSDDLRIRVPDVGGAFGQKGQLHAEYIVVAAAALRLGRPVKWVQGRRENLTVGAHGRGSRTRVRMTGETDGRIRALEVETLADAGAYPHSSAFVPLSTHLMSNGPYRFDAIDITTTVVTTTMTPTGPYRGAGRPEAAYALERCIEAFAREVDMDVADVRKKNLVRVTDMPYTTPTGAVYDGGDYSQALDAVLALMNYHERRKEQQRRRDRGDTPIGIGLAVFLDRTGGSSLKIGEYGSTEVDSDGIVTVRTGSTDSGQGHWPIWRRLAAEALHVDPDTITIVTSDTGLVREGTGTFASRSSQAGASSVHRTALKVREKALDLASRVLEIGRHDLVNDGSGGFFVKGIPDISISLADLARIAADEGEPLHSEEYFSPGAHTFPYAAHGAVVAVELKTGAVGIREYSAVDDCGRILDHTTVEGQVRGSIVQGIGQALFETLAPNETGQLMAGSLASYPIPHATDIPPISVSHTVTPAPSNPLGTKGIGESGTIGAPAAILNAVVDALTPWGVTDVPLPANPMNVWTALRTSKSALG